MISQIAYKQIGPLPVVAYLGMGTLVFFFLTALVGHLVLRGNARVSFKWHKWLAYAAFGVAIIHAIFAASAYLNF